jgi:hypothetical protein
MNVFLPIYGAPDQSRTHFAPASTWYTLAPLNEGAQVMWFDRYDILTCQLLGKNKMWSPYAITGRHYCKLWPFACTSVLAPCLWRNVALI